MEMESPNDSSILDDVSLYQEGFAHVEELLISSREECIEIGSRYQDMSLKVENLLHLQNSSSSSYDSAENEQPCDEKQMSQKYEARIAAYQANQEHQARIVSDLQSRVEEYRLRYAKLEAALEEQSIQEASIADTESQNVFSLDLETALTRLEQAKNKCQGLTQINNLLREQLETATDVNQTLTSDVQRLTREWQSVRAELLSKESEWREEEQTFSFYFTKENNRLLNIWREVLSCKHDFSAFRSHTERELASFQSSMGLGMQSARDVLAVLTSSDGRGTDTTDRVPLSSQISNNEIIFKKDESFAEGSTFQDRISDLMDRNDRLQQLLDDKDKSNTLLCSIVEKINETFNQTMNQTQPTILNNQQERLCSQYSKAFEDIFQVLLEDGSCDISSLISLEESSSFGVYGPLQLQSIVSAVKTSLQKYNKQTEEYKLQLTSSKEQNIMQQRTIEFLEDERQNGQQMNTRLSTQLEALNVKMQDLFLEMKSEDASKQSDALETTVKLLTEQLEFSRVERDQSVKMNEEKLKELQSKLQAVNDERKTLRQSEHTLILESERNARRINALEKTVETLKKDYQASQESLLQISLEKDLLEQEKSKFTTDLSNLKKQCCEQKQCLKDLKEEEVFVKDSLAALQSRSESLALEKADLSKALEEATSELKSVRSSHSSTRIELEGEKHELELHIERLEERAAQLEADRERLRAQLQALEEAKRTAEEERSHMSLANNDLTNQVTQYSSQKQTLEKELEQLRVQLSHALEQAAGQSSQAPPLECSQAELRLEGELEQLQREAGEEKVRLEGALDAARQLITRLQEESGDLARELDAERASSEVLKAQIKALEEFHEKFKEDSAKERNSLLLKMQEIEQEFQISLKKEQEQSSLEIENLKQEKATLNKKMIATIDELFESHQKQQDELLNKHHEEVANLKTQISSHEKEYGDKILLLKAESKKIHNDYKAQITSFEESIEKAKEELDQKEELVMQLEERISAAEREKSTWMLEHQEEVQALKEELGSLSSKHTNEINNIQKKMDSLLQEKEAALTDLHNLELSLKELEADKKKSEEELEECNLHYQNEKSSKGMLEDKLYLIQTQLNDEQCHNEVVNKSLEECKDRLKAVMKENFELKRVVDEAQQEITDKDASYGRVQTQVSELKAALAEVEKSRQELKREVHGLRRSQEKGLRAKDQEIAELNALRARDEEMLEALKKEIVMLKQKSLECSASGEALSKELGSCRQRCAELEHRVQVQREQHQAQLTECLSSEQSLAETRLGLEQSVLESSREIQALRAGLGYEEGKVLALENKVARMEGSKRDIENKLFSICMFLRSMLGLGSDSGFLSNPPPSHNSGLSEHLMGSPHRSSSRSMRFGASDADVEQLKASLTDLVRRFEAADRERVELKDTIAMMQREESAFKAEHSVCVLTIHQLKRELEDKKMLEKELASKIVRVTQSEEKIRTLEREKKRLIDKVDDVEFHSSSAQKEKGNIQAKLSEMKKVQVKLEMEASAQRAARESAEARALKYIRAYQAIEADLTSAREALDHRDNQAKSLKLEVETLRKKLKSSEIQVKSLQWDIDNQREITEKHIDNENRLKKQVSSMSITLSQSSESQHNLCKEVEKSNHENLRYQADLQNTLHDNEQLKNIAEEHQFKYEAAINKVGELKRVVAQKEAIVEDLRNQVKKYQSKLLDSHTAEAEVNEREKRSFEERIRELSASLKATREEMREKSELCEELMRESTSSKTKIEELKKEKARNSALSAKSMVEKNTLEEALSKMEVENQKLIVRTQNLQAQLAEMDERHSQRVKDFHHAQSSEESQLRRTLRETRDLMEAKEKTFRKKIMALEQKVKVLESHLDQEQRHWREWQSRSQGASSNISYLQSVLRQSLLNVSEDPHQLLPEAERLDQTTEGELRGDGIRLTTPSKLRGRRSLSLPRTSTPKERTSSPKS